MILVLSMLANAASLGWMISPEGITPSGGAASGTGDLDRCWGGAAAGTRCEPQGDGVFAGTTVRFEDAAEPPTWIGLAGALFCIAAGDAEGRLEGTARGASEYVNPALRVAISSSRRCSRL